MTPSAFAPDDFTMANSLLAIADVVSGSGGKCEMIKFPDIAGANNSLTSLAKKCDKCIGTLVINAHGSSGYANIGKDKLKVWTSNVEFNGFYFEIVNSKGFELFKGVNFCKPCNIQMVVCQSFFPPTSYGIKLTNLFFKAIAQTTGCSVEGWTGPVEPWIPGQTPGTYIWQPKAAAGYSKPICVSPGP